MTMIVHIDRRHRVRLLAECDIPLPASRVWEIVSDFERFTTRDPFHGRIDVEGGVLERGARIHIGHGYACFRLSRVGRILRWTPGVGYAFSDLSRHGPRTGFPHIYSYRVTPTGERTCRVSVAVRGRWTAQHIPRWLARLWLSWVTLQILHRVRNHLLWHAARERRAAHALRRAQTGPLR